MFVLLPTVTYTTIANQIRDVCPYTVNKERPSLARNALFPVTSHTHRLHLQLYNMLCFSNCVLYNEPIPSDFIYQSQISPRISAISLSTHQGSHQTYLFIHSNSVSPHTNNALFSDMPTPFPSIVRILYMRYQYISLLFQTIL